MTWEEFKKLFEEKFYNVAVRTSHQEDFMKLTKGKMSVAEYTLEFDRLSKFAGDLVPIDFTRKQKNCPQAKKEEPKKNTAQNPGRLSTMTQADGDASPSVVTGQLSTNGCSYTVLFDSGATHSYVSSRVIESFHRPCDIYASGFGTLLPLGDLIVSTRWIRSLSFWIDGCELTANLIELQLSDFDIILGMDFLSKYGAIIDCKQKMVMFEPDSANPAVFVGKIQGARIPRITLLKAKDLMGKGCLGFVVTIVDTSQPVTSGHENTRLVCEFLDVFPEDLLGLPPTREIEFVIELVTRVDPVSKAPYRMAPADAKRKEFTELVQNEGMSVTEYTTKFDRLAKLAVGIVPTDFSKKEKYLAGLNVKIRHDLVITTNEATFTGSRLA
ncbi:hypothetical protein CsatA_001433 [Cannabis sativa]